MSRNQALIVLCMLALLIVASLFDRWQAYIQQMFGETFEHKYMYLNLWFAPIAALVFAICWLILFRVTSQQANKITALVFLIVGICILFYPTVKMTIGVNLKLGISINYFGDTLLFYSAAIVSAIGILGLQKSQEK